MEYIEQAADYGGVELERDHFGRMIVNIGEMLLLAGAEISRVEDTIERLGYAYGAAEVNCFVITSSIMVTIGFVDTFNVSYTRRVTEIPGSNFTVIESINELSRLYCSGQITVEELEKRYLEIKEFKPDTRFRIVQYIGCMLVAGGAAVFFGGNVYDGIVGGILGLVVNLMLEKLEPICANKMMFNMISTFCLGLIICTLTKIFPVLQLECIISGEIMLLIPGVAFTISIKDIITGETLSGILRLIESIAWAIALAAGYMLAILIMM